MGVLRAEDLLRWRLRSTQRLIDRTIARIASISASGSWAVAFSGGKDSLALAALARKACPDIPIVWSDDEAETPEMLVGVQAARTHLGPPFWLVAGPCDHGLFRSWSANPPIREPLPGTIMITGRMDHWLITRGINSLIGTRGAESATRRMRGHGGKHWSAPLHDWTDADIWAAIAGLDLPISPLYDALIAAGWPRERCKTVPLIYALDGSYGPYRRLWPDLCRAVESRIIRIAAGDCRL